MQYIFGISFLLLSHVFKQRHEAQAGYFCPRLFSLLSFSVLLFYVFLTSAFKCFYSFFELCILYSATIEINYPVHQSYRAVAVNLLEMSAKLQQ